VPTDDLTGLYATIDTLRDLPASQLAQIAHFFEHYKDLETGKWVRVDGWAGPQEAKEEIVAGARRFSAESAASRT
jgi:inorganic pyrophosphatase